MTPRRRSVRAAARVAAVFLCFALPVAPVAAKDLGTRGASWPVAEADLLAAIGDRVAEMAGSGEWARLENEAREKARRSLESPPAVVGIFPAVEPRARMFDPAITVAKDLVGPNGEAVAAAGSRINPLALAPFSTELLFIDGRRDVEVAWALSLAGGGAGGTSANQRAGASVKIVLLAGRPLELMRRHGHPFFFDLGGRLSARFGVRATPTRMVRDGLLLRLTEIPLVDAAPPAVGDQTGKPTEPETPEIPIAPDTRSQHPC